MRACNWAEMLKVTCKRCKPPKAQDCSSADSQFSLGEMYSKAWTPEGVTLILASLGYCRIGRTHTLIEFDTSFSNTSKLCLYSCSKSLWLDIVPGQSCGIPSIHKGSSGPMMSLLHCHERYSTDNVEHHKPGNLK